MAKSGSQKRWVKEHHDDPYVKKAHAEGLRCRAAYKLIELQEKDRLFSANQIVVDLGSAPGGWSQVLPRWIGKNGKIIALDILPMDPLHQVNFIQGDFTSEEVYQELIKVLGNVLDGENQPKVDWVISDMAPNFAGDKAIDQPKSLYLVELALQFALEHLAPGGGFIAKLFQGAGFQEFQALVKKSFKHVAIRKPDASRDRSSECYLVARDKI
jgi:23S rRNA (uridine2552-2'-O)-methyltransferase